MNMHKIPLLCSTIIAHHSKSLKPPTYSFSPPSEAPESYTANVLTIKTTGTGNCGVPAGKICTIYGKGL